MYKYRLKEYNSYFINIKKYLQKLNYDIFDIKKYVKIRT